MESRKDDDAGDGAANPTEGTDDLPPQLNGEDRGQEEHSLTKEGEGGDEEDAASLDGEGQEAHDDQREQADQSLPNDRPEEGNEGVDIVADENAAAQNPADLNQGEGAAMGLQDEVNELKIELLSSQRNLDEAHERELLMQKQLDELSRQRSVEARASADKISRLENRIAELQRQLEDASRQQQQSPSSDLRIRAAEVQELKARIKQYEIKLASSEEISSIRKEAEMERVRTDASWQHRMLSDQVNSY